VIELELPYPPSVNHYWRSWRGRVLISRSGRAYRDAVGLVLRRMGVKPMAGRLAVHIELYPPDRRKRDLDNTLKAIGDSLQHGGAFEDDSQIVWLLIEKADVVKAGKIIVRIVERTCKNPTLQPLTPSSMN
jgi:crossover junction endodeoxyribonuclease RusA